MVHLATLLLALGSAPDGPAAGRVPTAATVERLPLAVPVSRVDLAVDSLNMRIELTTTANARAIYQRFAVSDPQLCPFISYSGNTVTLQCRTPRIEAILDPNNGRPVLEIHEVRGLPQAEDIDRIWFFYHPLALRFGSGCPGDTPAARGECQFKAGRFRDAALEFRKALQTENRQLAALRLGDISLRTGDPLTATGWYRMVGRYGSFGRVAVARLCELGGACLGEMRKRVFDATLLPEPLHSEMLIRGARAFAYIGAIKDSMVALLDAIRSNSHICDGETRVLCRRLVLFALKFPDKDRGVEAIETYMNLPLRTEGYLSIEMIRAAAEKALYIGAPLFAGHLLAASVPWIEGADVDALNEHLLRATEMYLLADDMARAHTLFVYADSRLGRRHLLGPRWATVIATVEKLGGRGEGSPVSEAARDLAEAYTALSRSLRLRQGQSQSTGSESP